MICHSKKFFYVHIPKTGGHSIDMTLLKMGLVEEKHDVEDWHATAAEIIDGLKAPWHYWSFATVRNPWDRMVSEYFWQMPHSNPDTGHEWGKKEITFEQFCRSAQEWYPTNERMYHMRPQTDYIYNGRELLVDLVLRFDTLQDSWRAVCFNHIVGNGWDIPTLPHLNNTFHKPYQEYYTPKLRDYVGNLYARDIELLGYKFGE